MAEATYVRLGYIDEKATIFVLRVTFAFLASASLFALVATLTYVRAANTAATYVAALSAIIKVMEACYMYRFEQDLYNEEECYRIV